MDFSEECLQYFKLSPIQDDNGLIMSISIPIVLNIFLLKSRTRIS